MARQLSIVSKEYLQVYDEWYGDWQMTTNIAMQRLQVGHIMKELEKEKARFARLQMPTLKHKSGVRVAMLRDRLQQNQNVLRELLIDKGYLSADAPR